MRKYLPPAGRAIAALVIATLTTIAAFTAAQAYNSPGTWNTQSRPLHLTSYSSEAWAAGSASIYNGSNGTRIYNKGTHKFTDADNHRPYLSGTSEWNAGTCANYSPTIAYKGVEVGASTSCAKSFYDGANFSRADGVTYTTSSWKAFATRSAVPNSGSDRGRAKIRLCLDIPLRPDGCTSYSYSPSDSF